MSCRIVLSVLQRWENENSFVQAAKKACEALASSVGLTIDKEKHVLELEAESAAFIVCDALGLDTSDYSFAYLAGWAEKPEEILPAAECACKLADKIVKAINPVSA